MWTPFALAVQLLTRVPLTTSAPPTEADFGRSVLAYPLVGLLIGLTLAGLHYLLASTPAMLQAALLLSLWVMLTGALHLDGVADMADAWVGGHGDRDQTLRILKDPASGPMGVTAVVLLLLVKFSALTALIGIGHWPALIIAPLLGRTVLVAAFLFIPYARPDGLGSAHARSLPRHAAVGALLLTLGAVIAASGWTGAVMVATSTGVFLLLRRATTRRIGGLTGDVAGSLCESVEAASLVIAVILLSSGPAA